MYVSTSEIVQKANSIVAQCGTRDPLRIARDLGIEVRYYPFKEQRGAYKVMLRNRFIFLKNNLHPVMENIVLLHEIGHDSLHRDEATKAGGFKEFEIFNIGEYFEKLDHLITLHQRKGKAAVSGCSNDANNSKGVCCKARDFGYKCHKKDESK